MINLAMVLAILLFTAGLLGTILPILPGAILIYGGMLLYGFMTDFTSLDVTFFLIQGLILAFTFFIDFLASAIGTRKFNGSKQATWGAVIGTIAGLFFFAPLGLIIGPFLGAVVAELLRGTDINRAVRVGFGTLMGILGGTILKLIAEVLMIIYFFIRI